MMQLDARLKAGGGQRRVRSRPETSRGFLAAVYGWFARGSSTVTPTEQARRQRGATRNWRKTARFHQISTLKSSRVPLFQMVDISQL
ncbi:hypothetical protein E2562_031057 [Oryza meyeriana var. granulata]|uniref:Uncharacterized protein n=1 Tax=Oryza meyeriana var. granulata TaxID=110450 RepID=A0A6G1FEG8_9ORYZ|nr:hypothetical protein E2562_031057 [Oryza meyeriana var. granulata]